MLPTKEMLANVAPDNEIAIALIGLVTFSIWVLYRVTVIVLKNNKKGGGK